MIKRTLWLVACCAVACGGDDEAPSDPDVPSDSDGDTSADTSEDPGTDSAGDVDAVEAADADAASGDTTPPRLRDLRASIDGPVSTDVDLNGDDALVHLPVESLATFTVFASDETTAGDVLVVDLVDADGTAVAPIESTFRNGLWSTSVSVRPGTALRARVADEAGNVVISDAALLVPSIEESILGEWSTRFFGEAQVQSSVRHHTWEAGDWSATEGEFAASGAWSFDGEHLVVETAETTGDADSRRRAEVYIDEIYFSIGPLRLESGGEDGLVGAWGNTAWTGSVDAEVAIATSLALGDDGTFTLSEGDASSAGDWRTEVNEDYSEAFGNFIVFETSIRDGAELAEVETEVLLYRRRGDSLLLSPQLRDSEE